MAQQGVELNQEHFSCSICLDLLRDPVTIPCGHSYCMGCIKGCWDREDPKEYGLYSCPQCRDSFHPRPVLKKSNMLADVVESLKKTRSRAGPPDLCYAGPGDVACDSCTGRKRKSVKACLQCMVSYCNDHLQPHYQSPAFKKHKLVNASSELRENICTRHVEVRNLFCRTDQQCICYLCSVEEHKGHDTISAAAARTERQKELDKSEQNIHQRIQDREKDMKVLKQISDQLKNDMSWAEEQLRKRVEQLRRRHAELELLSHTDDDIHFLQRYTYLSSFSEYTHAVSSNVRPLHYIEDLTVAVSKIRGQLEDILKEEEIKETKSEPKTRDEFLQYLCPITLDPNTAHIDMSLSKGNKKVTSYPTYQFDAIRQHHPERFRQWFQVLCRESLTGRCYWELEWSGFLVNIAVSYKDISRTGLKQSLFGANDTSWIIQCCNSNFTARHRDITTQIPGRVSSRVGVYLDHSAGTLSFYKVCDTMTLLHRVQTTFTQPLYAGVGLSVNGSSVELCDLK